MYCRSQRLEKSSCSPYSVIVAESFMYECNCDLELGCPSQDVQCPLEFSMKLLKARFKYLRVASSL